MKENGKFLYNEHEQIERLKKFANSNITVSKQDLIDAVTFFSSIFTVNFCEIEERLSKQDKKPYILLASRLVQARKPLPLKIILERWKGVNILDGLVTSENIAQDYKM